MGTRTYCTARGNYRQRYNRRGGILATAMLFFVMVAVAGTAILSMSVVTKLKFVRQSIDVRMLIAAEAGIETVRGRFTLVAGVQEDWSALMPTNGWNDVGGPMIINGISVQAQARPIGGPDVLQARVRAVATVQQRSRAVEYNIQAANFADYALYFGSSNTVGIGTYFKMVGNIYAVGSINLSNGAGIEFYGDVDTSEKVLNAPNPVYNFKKGYTEFVPIVTIPPAAYGLTPMRNAAIASGTLFYSNTISIELVGEEFIRTYEYRQSGTGTNYNPNHYVVQTETLDIPDNSVIYIDSDTAPAGTDSYGTSALTANQGSTDDLSLWGVLDERRVTIACEHFVSVVDDICYQTLLDNPDLRRFTQKKEAPALAFREMLGVLSYEDIEFETTLWTALDNSQEVVDNASLVPPDTGHYGTQFCLDGVFMGVGKAARTSVGPSTGKELWVCGGIINLNYPSTLLASNFDRRNYDTDYRLKFTTPPYFLRAYNETANMIPGSWRTYEL
jgi:hypothetical protein